MAMKKWDSDSDVFVFYENFHTFISIRMTHSII